MPNSAPITVADIVTITEFNAYTPHYIDVLTNDSDPDGDPLGLVLGSLVVTGFAASLGVSLTPLGGPVINTSWLQGQFYTDSGNNKILCSATGNPDTFQFLSAGQSITVNMTYNVTDGMGNITQSSLALTINGINNVVTLNDTANHVAEYTNVFQSTRFVDEIYAMGGDDIIYALSGDDLVYGGTGDDSLYGGDGADKLYGEADDDLLSGGSGADILYGGAGDDRLEGGSGNDTLYGGAGADAFIGGSGFDLVRYNDANWGNLIIDMSQPVTLNTVAAAGDTYSGIEGIFGGNGNDRISGDIYDNRLYGSNGSDTLEGSSGNDRLIGGSGADKFVFNYLQYLDPTTSGVDQIDDFTHGIDKIQFFSGQMLSTIGATLDANEIAFGTAPMDTNDYIIFDAATKNLYYDADGSGTGGQLLFATLLGVTTLDYNDFIVV